LGDRLSVTVRDVVGNQCVEIIGAEKKNNKRGKRSKTGKKGPSKED